MGICLSVRLCRWLLMAIELPLARMLVHLLAVAADHHDTCSARLQVLPVQPVRLDGPVQRQSASARLQPHDPRWAGWRRAECPVPRALAKETRQRRSRT
jgi:hypothetical protein